MHDDNVLIEGWLSMEILKQLIRANHQRSGLKTLKLYKVEPAFFAQLQREAQLLIESNQPSEVGYANHVTNWTRPYGNAVQFSLLNRSGNFDDTSADHSLDLRGKRFHHANKYPAIDEFIRQFPDAFNMRLNGIGPKAGLSKHKEHLYIKVDKESYMIRARFHLPVKTTSEAEMYLDGDFYHFDEGLIYLFNNGCVHAALNQGDDFRYHFVWDVFLTERATEQMFGSGGAIPIWLRRVESDERVVPIRRTEKIGEYGVQFVPRFYHQLGLARLGIKPHQLQNIYNSLQYYRNYYFKRPAFVHLADIHVNRSGVA